MINRGFLTAHFCLTATTTALFASTCGYASASQTHKLKHGETVELLSYRYNVSLKDILAANHLHANDILREGRVIHIPSKSKAVVVQSTRRSSARIKGDRISVRTGPSSTHHRLRVCEDGTPLVITARRGDWLQVRLSDGSSGWVRSDFVQHRKGGSHGDLARNTPKRKSNSDPPVSPAALTAGRERLRMHHASAGRADKIARKHHEERHPLSGSAVAIRERSHDSATSNHHKHAVAIAKVKHERHLMELAAAKRHAAKAAAHHHAEETASARRHHKHIAEAAAAHHKKRLQEIAEAKHRKHLAEIAAKRHHQHMLEIAKAGHHNSHSQSTAHARHLAEIAKAERQKHGHAASASQKKHHEQELAHERRAKHLQEIAATKHRHHLEAQSSARRHHLAAIANHEHRAALAEKHHLAAIANHEHRAAMAKQHHLAAIANHEHRAALALRRHSDRGYSHHFRPEAESPAAGNDVVRAAYAYRGTPYRWGMSRPGGFDCSGFTKYVYGRKGVSLPRTAAEQYHAGHAVGHKSMKPGDLVFFHTTRSGISHVGMYVGSGKFVHSSSKGSGGVRVDSLESGYYSKAFRGARRVSKETNEPSGE